MGAFFSANTIPYFLANGISVGCTLVVIALALWLRIRGHVNRASLMLQAVVSMVDLARHIRLFFSSSDNPLLCTAMAAFSFFGDHLSMLLNVAIAANLHHIYLLGKRPGTLWHRMLWLSPILAVLVIDSIPLMMGAYGKSPSGICFLNPDHKYRIFFKIYLLYATLYIGIIYCLVISILVYLKAITHTSSYLTLNLTPRGPSFGTYNTLINYFAVRIALYPLSCFISHFGFMAMGFTYDFTNHINPSLLSLGLFLQSTTGIVNLICLCFDPSLIEVLKTNFQCSAPGTYPIFRWGHKLNLCLEASPQAGLNSQPSDDTVQNLTELLEQF